MCQNFSFQVCLHRTTSVRNIHISDWYIHKCTFNDVKNVIVLSESPLKIRVYRFLISLLVQELLRFKDLKNDRKNGTNDCAVMGKIKKLTESVTSYHGHPVPNNL